MDKVDKIPTNIEIYNGENVYLMGSSLFLLAPGIHALSKKNYLLAGISLVGPLVSYKYWSRPRYDVWRNVDMICANFGIGMFMGNVVWNVKQPIYKYAICSLYSIGGLFYALGSHEHEKRNQSWFLYHGAMHATMLLGNALNVCVTP